MTRFASAAHLLGGGCNRALVCARQSQLMQLARGFCIIRCF